MGRARLAQGFIELKEPQMEQRGRGAGEQISSPFPGTPALLPRQSIFKRDGLVIVLFMALTGVMTNPLILHLANAVEDKQDALLNTWIIAWVGHALITDPLNLFNANIFHPYPNTLAYSETMLPQGLFALPFNLAFDNPILGYNLVLLASFLLAAYAMYLFIFDLTRNRGAAIIAGTIFAFNPYNLGNLAQVQLLSFGWMPFVMLWLRRLLTADRALRFGIGALRVRICFLFALAFSLQGLSSFYYAFLAGFAVALYSIWIFVIDRPRLSALVRVLTSALIIAVIITPFFIPYLQVQREMGFERQVAESEPFSASLKLFAEVSPQNLVYGKFLAPNPPVMIGGYPLDNLFPGIVAVALAIVGITAIKHRDKWFYFVLLTFAFLLSLGPRLFLAPNVPTDLTLPYRWLYDTFPLMRALRAPVRFDALVMFALAVLAGLGFSRLLPLASCLLPPAFRLSPPASCLLLTGFTVLEYLAFPAANITPVPVWNEIPEYVRWLRQQAPGVILELPMIASDSTKPLDLTTQYLSTYHWHTTPDGYSGFNAPKRGEIAYEMQAFPGDRSMALLQVLGVEYVITHRNQLANWGTMRESISRTAALQLAKQAGNDYLYRVSPREQDASSLAASIYLPQPAMPGQNYFAFIIVRNRGTNNFAIKPTDQWRIDATWSDGVTQSVRATLPLVTSNASVIPVRLIAPPRAGLNRLALRVRGDRIDWHLSGEVNVQAGEPAHQVVIPASVGLRAPLKTLYAPGDSIAIEVTWLPLNKIDAYYSASVRVVDARGNKIVAQDREPAGSTFLWKPTITVADRFTLTLPNNLAPGEYSIQVMMYQADQGVEVLMLDENFTPHAIIELGKFSVK